MVERRLLVKFLPLLNSFLRSDRKISELGLPRIKKAESAPEASLNHN